MPQGNFDPEFMRMIASKPRKKKRFPGQRYTVSPNEKLALKELVNTWGFSIEEVATAAKISTKTLKSILKDPLAVKTTSIVRDPDKGDEPWIVKSPLISRPTEN